MDEPARAAAKLERHQLRSGLVPPVRVVEVVARRDPGAAARAAVIERCGRDRVVRDYTDLYATLTRDMA